MLVRGDVIPLFPVCGWPRDIVVSEKYIFSINASGISSSFFVSNHYQFKTVQEKFAFCIDDVVYVHENNFLIGLNRDQ